MGVAPTIQTLRTSASSTALRASTTTNNQNLSQEKPDVKSVGEQLEELDSRIWNELGIESGSDFAGQPEKIKSYASSVKDYLDANGIKELDRETFSFLEAINYHTLNNILGLHGVYGEEFRRKLFVEGELKKLIDSYGYEDMQTPVFEFFDIFSRTISSFMERFERFTSTKTGFSPAVITDAIDANAHRRFSGFERFLIF